MSKCHSGVAAAALVAVVVMAGSAHAVGPYPDLGTCSVFPQPPASLSPRAASLPTEAAWNQDVSKAPRDSRSAAYIAYIDSHGGDRLHPDFGSPRPYGFPYSVVGAGQRKLPVHYTAYGDESDPGPFPVPPRSPVEGGNRSDGDRHVLVVDRSACKLYELYRAFYVAKPHPHWNADSGTEWDLRSAARYRNDPGSRNLWGGAVGVAKVLAATTARHTIAASETAYELLSGQFLFRARGSYFLPETGNMRTFVMVGRT